MTRRNATGMLAGGAFTAMMPIGAATAARQKPAAAGYSGKRIDLHHHFVPPFYREILTAKGLTRADGGRGLPEWNEADMLAAMDTLRIERAILSISSPGVHFGDDAEARTLARRVNEEGARLVAAHPGKFGFFASTPLPDVEGAVAETIHALDKLGAAGLVFESNFNGVYLGDERLGPVYAELDKRGALLFIHPTSPDLSCGCGDGSGRIKHDLMLGYPGAMMEFMFETTRTVANMVLSGVFTKYPNIKLLIPHAGATLPLLARRIDTVSGMQGKGQTQSLREALGKFHFDLAGMPVPELLSMLLTVADHGKIHYGSDYPHTPMRALQALADTLDTTSLLTPKQRADFMINNARALLDKRS